MNKQINQTTNNKQQKATAKQRQCKNKQTTKPETLETKKQSNE